MKSNATPHYTIVCHGVRQEEKKWNLNKDIGLKYLAEHITDTAIIPFYYNDLLEKARSNKLADGLSQVGMIAGHVWRPELFFLWSLLPRFGDFIGDAAAYGSGDVYPYVQDRLYELVKALKTKHQGDCEITLVGYSLGSLVVFEFDCNFPRMVDNVVTIGSPMDLFLFSGAVLKRTGRMNECYAYHKNYVGTRDWVHGFLNKELNKFIPDVQYFLKGQDHGWFSYLVNIHKLHTLDYMIKNNSNKGEV